MFTKIMSTYIPSIIPKAQICYVLCSANAAQIWAMCQPNNYPKALILSRHMFGYVVGLQFFLVSKCFYGLSSLDRNSSV